MTLSKVKYMKLEISKENVFIDLSINNGYTMTVLLLSDLV
jgi:hypothetical protein